MKRMDLVRNGGKRHEAFVRYAGRLTYEAGKE